MKKLIVETGSGTAVIPRQRLLELALPWSHATTATKLHWIFRIAVAMEFVGHGAFGIIGKKAWVPYITVFGFSESTAWQLMPLVGAVDIGLGILTLFRPMPAVLAHMTLWGLMTASLRPVTGEPVWELLERGGNYAVPLAFLLLSGGGGRSLRGWLRQVKSSSVDSATIQKIAWALRAGTAALLIGHGGFGAFMHKQEWFGYFAAVGIGPDTVTTGHLIGVVGWFEIALGVAVLFKPARSLLLFVVAWKVGTEFLRYSAGEPMWEFIERGGSYAAPLALLIATTWLRREKALTATAESAGPRTLTDSGFSRQESEIPRVDLFGEPGRILREQTLPRRGPGAHRSRETAIPK